MTNTRTFIVIRQSGTPVVVVVVFAITLCSKLELIGTSLGSHLTNAYQTRQPAPQIWTRILRLYREPSGDAVGRLEERVDVQLLHYTDQN